MKKIEPIKFKDIMHISEFNDHHGTNFSGWQDLHIEMGYNMTLINNWDDLYLNWLEKFNTPLYNALKEE